MYKLAVFSLVQNEDVWPEIWVKHYLKHTTPDRIYLLDHDSSPEHQEHYKSLAFRYNIKILRVNHETTHHHAWLASTASKFQSFLLNSHDAVLYTDIDEFVVPHPDCEFKTIADFAEYYLTGPRQVIRCSGFEVVHQLHKEPQLDFALRPLLAQRSSWYGCVSYSKPLLANKPINWIEGFHSAVGLAPTEVIDNDLLLLHLHKIDFDYALERHINITSRKWSESDRIANMGFQNRITDRQKLAVWFKQHVDKIDPNTGKTGNAEFKPIPKNIQELL